MNILLILVTGLALIATRQSQLSDEQEATKATSRILERTTKLALDKAGLVVQSAADQLEQEISTGGIDRDALWPRLDRLSARVPLIQVLAVFDQGGQQVCGVEPPGRCRNLNVRDRPYFWAARHGEQSNLLLHAPLSSLLDIEPIMALTKARRRPEGQFAGIVLALLPSSAFHELIEDVTSANGAAAGLRTLDLPVIARSPQLPTDNGRPAIPENLRRQVALNPVEGAYRARTGSDGVDRLAAYRPVDGWPTYVLVGSAADDVLADWWKFAVVSAALVGLASWIAWRWAATDRRALQAQRRAQCLYEQAPCGYHTLDANGKYAEVNATELQWLGLQKSELIGERSPREFLTADSQVLFDRCFPTLATEGRLAGLELDFVGEGGRVMRMLVNAKARFDAQGRFSGSYSVIQDITELSAARASLRALARDQAAMLNTDLVGIAKLKGRRIEWANLGMTRLLGYSSYEFMQMPMLTLHPDAETFLRVGEDSYPRLTAGQFHRVEMQMRHKDGRLLWMDAGGAPLSEGAGEIMMILADITERKEAEKLRLHSIELQAQNTQLIETKRLQDEFLANMSQVDAVRVQQRTE